MVGNMTPEIAVTRDDAIGPSVTITWFCTNIGENMPYGVKLTNRVASVCGLLSSRFRARFEDRMLARGLSSYQSNQLTRS